jgi:hypothetical protein
MISKSSTKITWSVSNAEARNIKLHTDFFVVFCILLVAFKFELELELVLEERRGVGRCRW